MNTFTRSAAVSTWALAMLTTFAVPHAGAATSNVACSPAALIVHIDIANQDATPDTLKLADDCVYDLDAADHTDAHGSTGLPRVTTPITILGQGAHVRRAQGAADFRIFEVGGEGGDDASLVLEGLTVARGRAVGHAGGGIFVHDNGGLTLIDSIVEHNYSSLTGGGIFSDGDLMIVDSTITGNEAAYRGGGVFAFDVTITDSTVSWNQAAVGASYGGEQPPEYTGGGIAAVKATVHGVVFDHNSALSGGALVAGALTTITQSLFVGNSGGAVYFQPADFKFVDVSVAGSTFTVNQPYAITTPTQIAGVWGLPPLDLTLVNSTFFAGEDSTHLRVTGDLTVRHSTLVGGDFGVFEEDREYGATVTFANSIVTGASTANCAGGIEGDPGNPNNLSDDDSCGATFSVADPELGTIKLNGGPLPTIVPLSGSPAIDAGDFSACAHGDQRGFTRPADGDLNGLAACDIGAIEVGAADVTITKEGDAAVSPGERLTYTIKLRNGSSAPATDVAMIDTLPPGTVLESVRTSHGDCRVTVAERDTVTCALGALEERERATIIIAVRVTEPRDTLIVNTARLTTSSPDPDLHDNSATASTRVLPARVRRTTASGGMPSGAG